MKIMSVTEAIESTDRLIIVRSEEHGGWGVTDVEGSHWKAFLWSTSLDGVLTRWFAYKNPTNTDYLVVKATKPERAAILKIERNPWVKDGLQYRPHPYAIEWWPSNKYAKKLGGYLRGERLIPKKRKAG